MPPVAAAVALAAGEISIGALIGQAVFGAFASFAVPAIGGRRINGIAAT